MAGIRRLSGCQGRCSNSMGRQKALHWRGRVCRLDCSWRWFETYIAAKWKEHHVQIGLLISASGIMWYRYQKCCFLLSGIYLVLMSPAFVCVAMGTVITECWVNENVVLKILIPDLSRLTAGWLIVVYSSRKWCFAFVCRLGYVVSFDNRVVEYLLWSSTNLTLAQLAKYAFKL